MVISIPYCESLLQLNVCPFRTAIPMRLFREIACFCAEIRTKGYPSIYIIEEELDSATCDAIQRSVITKVSASKILIVVKNLWVNRRYKLHKCICLEEYQNLLLVLYKRVLALMIRHRIDKA